MPKKAALVKRLEAPADSAADSAAVWCSTSRLKPWPGNPRKNAHAIRDTAGSIKRFGWGAVILAREENGEMVAGHTRFGAAELLVAEYPRATVKQREAWHPDAVRVARTGEVPVRFGTWSEREAHLLAIADNKLNEKAEWVTDQVEAILSEYSLGEAVVAGYGADELSKLIQAIADSGGERGGAGSSLGAGLKYSLLVECVDEQGQSDLMDRLELEGFACKPMVS